jgi:hypothetical protein
MVVDGEFRFVTQRECPGMALVRVAAEGPRLVLEAPGAPRLVVPVPQGERREVVVWRDTVPALDAGDDAARWLRSRLAREVRLVRFDRRGRRPCNPTGIGDSSAHTLFSDGYPVLVIGQASLDDLNRRLVQRGRRPVPMVRFRPNVVVDGLEPNDEDHVATIETDHVTLRLAKPCTRCAITTVDPDTAEPGREPLETLAGYRMDERWGGITFGVNAIVERPGPIAVGETARIRYRF